MKLSIKNLTKWCAYSHLVKVGSALIKGEAISEQARAGRNIALLGLFCPFFWYALLTGANKAELAFHATHSGVVIMIGLVLMFIGLKKRC
ncbi:hypothetical protein [Reinekea marinisedimentorum]|uniref:Uncharacterized protein n=1 Tax=Reinekea marinisedimentorum TaxID=230495 RepID=A0A4R3HWE2_9GAMM|nr:hypothetical protein [Reinekea marinisedimentorum]TCS35699.1 hypothetical protein BCF53_1319 [Reinekea marinisedimentorum]